MPVLAAYMVPHPPMIIPRIGKGSERQIAETVAEQVAGGRISVRVEIPEQQTGYAPDVNMYLNTDKLRSLGWKPAHRLADSYARLVAYIRESAENN